MKTRYYQNLTKSNSFSFVKDKFSFHLLFFGVDAKGAFSPGSGGGGGGDSAYEMGGDARRLA